MFGNILQKATAACTIRRGYRLASEIVAIQAAHHIEICESVVLVYKCCVHGHRYGHSTQDVNLGKTRRCIMASEEAAAGHAQPSSYLEALSSKVHTVTSAGIACALYKGHAHVQELLMEEADLDVAALRRLSKCVPAQIHT